MTDDEIIVLCMEVINIHKERTERDFYELRGKFNKLFAVANSRFQAECIRAAYNSLWNPEIKTAVTIFENII